MTNPACWIGTVALAVLPVISPSLARADSAPAGAAECARELIARVAPGHEKDFTCQLIPADGARDVFEYEAQGGKIALRGNSPLSLAVAFNRYLRQEAKCSFDWQAAGPLDLPARLPMPAAKVRDTCAARERFFLNYCTYGYTLPWWGWEQWQRFVDWMAMNGINRPLLQCGQEAAWLRVWKSYGLSDEQVRSFFVGPAHLPWQRMVNIDRWAGPLPLSYIEGQRKLQQQILARARALGMKPILAGFAGHVPEALRAVQPQAKIIRIAPGWGGMPESCATWFLDPTDPLFQDVQVRFLRQQTELYGTDHAYGADPFNEIAPPSWEPDYLASVAKSIYGGMTAVDPQAVWYQMSWNFYYDKRWTQPRLEAMTRAVPTGRMVYLDYICEDVEFFRKTESFYGAPFLWCYLANFGGNTHFTAPVNKLSSRMTPALAVTNCLGVGSTLEGLNINPIAYDLLFDQPWRAGAAVDMTQWIRDYADRRAGRADAAVRRAWRSVAENLLIDHQEGLWGRGVIYEWGPHFDKNWNGTGRAEPKPAKQDLLVDAVAQLLKAEPASRESDGFEFDVVNLLRQALGNYAGVVHFRMMRAAARQDLEAFRRESAHFLEIGRDLDRLLGTRHEYLMGRWIADARAWGANNEERAYYEKNARQILTTWGPPGGILSDYAHRLWNGLLGSYYLGRWTEFVARLDAALAAKQDFDQDAYHKWRVAFDGQWIERQGEGLAETPRGKPFDVAKSLFEKYGEEMTAQAGLPAGGSAGTIWDSMDESGGAPVALIPWPRSLTMEKGAMPLTAKSRIVAGDAKLKPLAAVLSDEIATLTGLRLATAEGKAADGDIALRLDPDLKDEEYALDVGARATVRAGNAFDVAAGTATLLQALKENGGAVAIPRMRVADKPAYRYRGVLIDLARKYHTPGGIKQVIELCRLYKIRYLQLHLTDDQLFMFPSVKFPQAGKGNWEFARFEPGSKPKIQPYTLGELRDLEKFSQERGVHIVPEMDLPGHSGRLVGDVPEVFSFPGNGNTVNIASPKTLAAVEALLNEVMDVFQGTPYVHLGADEVGLGGLERTAEYKEAQQRLGNIRSSHDLYCKFVTDLRDIVARRGKQAIVWEEAWNPDGAYPLPKDAIVMAWTHGRNPVDIAAKGYQVINAEWTPLYIVRGDKRPLDFLFDWKVNLFGQGHLGNNAFTTVTNRAAILGAQLCSWENAENIEIQSLRDRLAMVAEKAWNPEAGGTLGLFRERHAVSDGKLDRLVNPIEIRASGPFAQDENTFTQPMTITLTPRVPGLTIRYTLDNSLPNESWKVYQGPIAVEETVHLRAGLFDAAGRQQGYLVGSWFKAKLAAKPNLATGKPVTISPGATNPDHLNSGLAVDGKSDDQESHWDAGVAPQWLQVDLQKVYPIDHISVITYWDGGRYYQLTVEASEDGKAWKPVLDFSKNTTPATSAGYGGTFPKTNARYVRVNLLKNSANPSVHIVELIVDEAK